MPRPARSSPRRERILEKVRTALRGKEEPAERRARAMLEVGPILRTRLKIPKYHWTKLNEADAAFLRILVSLQGKPAPSHLLPATFTQKDPIVIQRSNMRRMLKVYRDELPIFFSIRRDSNTKKLRHELDFVDGILKDDRAMQKRLNALHGKIKKKKVAAPTKGLLGDIASIFSSQFENEPFIVSKETLVQLLTVHANVGYRFLLEMGPKTQSDYVQQYIRIANPVLMGKNR